MNKEDMKWPDKPLAHLDDSQAVRFGDHATSYRPAEPNGRNKDDGYGYPFRSCAYCGSMHPEDLYNLLTTNPDVTLGGADWKYGWPHKFYVENIPNPKAGQRVSISSMSCGSVTSMTREDVEKEAKRYPNKEYVISVHKTENIEYEDDVETRRTSQSYWQIRWYEPGLKHTHAKFYNVHIKDIADDATREEFCRLIAEKGGIDFKLEADGKLKYSAPYAGYQH